MNISSIKNVVTSRSARTVLKAQKHSPTILFGLGTVGFVATTILAGKATLELDSINVDYTNQKHRVKQALADPNLGAYDEKAFGRDCARIEVRRALEVTKLYGPTVTVGMLSLACFTGSHVVLTKRNASLMAAYAALDKGFGEYRERVQAMLGTEEELKLRHSSETEEVHDTKKGEVKKVAKPSPHGASIYARFFSKDTSNSWDPRPEYNMLFLRAKQNYLNDILQTRGHVFLNEVYDELGLDRTKAGQQVGWVKDNGDGYIDFGVFTDDAMDRFHDFMTGREQELLLDFNVDGVVLDLI